MVRNSKTKLPDNGSVARSTSANVSTDPAGTAVDADATNQLAVANRGPAAVVDGDQPVTKRELARLLRAFAHMIERFDVAENDTAPRRAPRKAKEPLEPPSELTRARARAALRKMGTLP